MAASTIPERGTLEERVARALVEWLTTEPKRIAEGMMEHGRASFTAKTSQGEALAYYRSLLILPGGSVNTQAVQQIQQRVGPAGMLEISRQLLRDAKRIRGLIDTASEGE